ncbi:hypothetical protein [Streptodolium elevatio]|uniref:Uncharacterized protein n=1 Tax=Streptodolium elevatio TaxID=3157996 RepID=A0ABV3DJ44_9ACTN
MELAEVRSPEDFTAALTALLDRRLAGTTAAQREKTGVAPNTLVNWRAGTIPRTEQFDRLLRALFQPSDDPVRDAAHTRIRTTWHNARDRAETTQAKRRRTAPSPPAAVDRPGIPVAAADPFLLGVHPAVETSDDPGPARTLPLYVPRAHDRWLREAVAAAAAGPGELITLVGESSTGKTRACWEALRQLPEGWRVWHPLEPTPHEALFAGVDRVGPRTVLWLNEAQRYLLDPGPYGGRRAAAALQTLLARARGSGGPVVVLATLWREHWNTLTGPPGADGTDWYAQQRELLAGASLHTTIPDRFTPDDLAALRAAARDDSQLRLASEHAANTGEITQFLAGAPWLLNRYDNADVGAKALLHAAMDYRRLGHSEILPLDLLADAAPGYLTDREWDELPDHWLEDAVTYCAQRRHRVAAPLGRVRPRPGQSVQGPAVGFRLTDFLDQHGRRTRRIQRLHVTFWEAAARHTRAHSDLVALMTAAAARLRFRHATLLAWAAADAGDESALRWLAVRADEAGDGAEAERLARAAADAGGTTTLRWLAVRADEAGNGAEGERLARAAADAGDPSALAWLAGRRDRAGNGAEGERLFRAAADAGDTTALVRLAERRESAEAERLARAAADAGDPSALAQLALRRDKAADGAEGERLARAAADAGDASALAWLAARRDRAGNGTEAERLAQVAADAGHEAALIGFGLFSSLRGRRSQAELIQRYGLEPDGTPSAPGDPRPAPPAPDPRTGPPA